MHNFDDLSCLNSALNAGAFLTSGDNTMIASWGFVGVMWGKKIYIAPVRDSRYTKEIIDKTGEFTVSVPRAGEMADAIKFCGRNSGRDFDKWAECGLDKICAKSVDSFVVGGCQKYFECKVLGTMPMSTEFMQMFDKWYPTGDNHNFVFGEIVAEY